MFEIMLKDKLPSHGEGTNSLASHGLAEGVACETTFSYYAPDFKELCSTPPY